MPRRVRYAEHRDGFCDVYGSADRRALLVHGGFWRDRYDLSLMEGLCDDLADRGWEAWNVEYRRLGRGGARWPEMADDLREAASAADARVAIGHSAGGHIALWLAAEGLVGAAVGQAPVSDLVAGAAAERRCGGRARRRPRTPRRWRASRSARPQLVVHGDRDENVPVAMSRDYVAAARAAGDEVDYDERPGEGHFEHLDPRAGAWLVVANWLERLA